MALEISIDVCQSINCKSLVVSHTTGNYSEDNPTGLGSPNEPLSDLISATLTLFFPATDETFSIDVLTEISEEEDIIITSQMIGLEYDITLPDVEIDISLDLVFEDDEDVQTNYSTVVKKLLYCNFECFVFNKLATMSIQEPDCCSDTNKDSIKEVIKLWAYLKSLERSAQCGGLYRYNDIMVIINKVQGVRDCNCNS